MAHWPLVFNSFLFDWGIAILTNKAKTFNNSNVLYRMHCLTTVVKNNHSIDAHSGLVHSGKHMFPRFGIQSLLATHRVCNTSMRILTLFWTAPKLNCIGCQLNVFILWFEKRCHKIRNFQFMSRTLFDWPMVLYFAYMMGLNVFGYPS